MVTYIKGGVLSDETIERLYEINKLPRELCENFFNNILELFSKEYIGDKDRELLNKCPNARAAAILLMTYGQRLLSNDEAKLKGHIDSTASYAKFLARENSDTDSTKISKSDESAPVDDREESAKPTVINDSNSSKDQNPIPRSPEISNDATIMIDAGSFLKKVGLSKHFNKATKTINDVCKNVTASIQKEFEELNNYNQELSQEEIVEHKFRTVVCTISNAMRKKSNKRKIENEFIVSRHLATKKSGDKVEASLYPYYSKKDPFSNLLLNIEIKANKSKPSSSEYEQIVNNATDTLKSEQKNYTFSGLVKGSELYFYCFSKDVKAFRVDLGKVIPESIGDVAKIKSSIRFLAFLMTLDQVSLGFAFKDDKKK
ncbi:hypothetical protein H4219_005378 [Mycoemilia scoparia]|uniref:Uncharacterized protein n=1 Tax=Mycoemilia scoparia TaxID=417184 RepID=A0A9W7ZTZ1_9FUNG|nr:hypothetical protein H4219_005378 [Mycoemilia scoparia]